MNNIKRMELDKIVYRIAIISLFFTITNRIPVSAFLSAAVILFPIAYFREKAVLPEYVYALIMLLTFFFLSALLYQWRQVFQYGFYRRDGNVFVTFAPILALSVYRIDCDVEKVMSGFLRFTVYANIVCIVIWLITGNVFGIGNRHEYHFLFIAHNACGGFLSTVLAFCIAFYVTKRERKYLLYGFVHALGLYFSDSRGSMIGIIAGLFLYCLIYKKKKPSLDMHIIAVMIFMNVLIEIFIYSVLAVNGVDVSKNIYDFALPLVFEGMLGGVFTYISRSWTIILRVFHLWPYAISMFLYSPFLGTGFGSYNDFPYSLKGIKHILGYKAPEMIINNSGHAHNTFLHILAENGIVGLGLLLFFLVRLRKYIMQIENEAIRMALHLALLTILVCSFTEHRLFIPSQVFPFTIILGLVTANRNLNEDKFYSD